MIRTCLRLAATAALVAGGAAAFGQATPAGSAPGMSGNVLNPMAPPGGMTDSSGQSGAMLDQVERARREARGDRVRTGSASSSRASRARPATAQEVIAGAAVLDSTGVHIGTIESVNAEGAVILYGTSRARIPLEAFGHNSGGLLLGMTKAEFEQAVAAPATTPS